MSETNNCTEEIIDNTPDTVEEDYFENARKMRKFYASGEWRVDLGLFIIAASQLALVFIQGILSNDLIDFNEFAGIHTYLTIVAADSIGILALLLLLKKREKTVIEKKKLGILKWLLLLICTYGVAGVGAIIGTYVNSLLLKPLGYSLIETNASMELLTQDTSWGYIISGVIVAGLVAPALEEILFRKIIIDNFSKYGKGAAILMSGLMFGLYHGNFQQFFMAFGIGILFAYVYAYTGKIKYTIFLHAGFNLYASGLLTVTMNLVDYDFVDKINGVVNEFVETRDMNAYLVAVNNLMSGNETKLAGIMLFFVTLILLYVIYFAGVVFCIIFAKKFFKFRKENADKNIKGSKTAAVFNWGMVCFYIIAGFMFANYYLGMIISAL